MSEPINKLDSNESFLRMFLKFKNYIIGDIDKLVTIAEASAIEEYDNFINSQSKTLTYQTTQRDGDTVSEDKLFFQSRCTIPLCMIIFSAIDFLGRLSDPLYIEDKNQKKKILTSTEFRRHAQLFFSYLCGRNDLDSDERSSEFEKKYRHSIMHSYLSSAGDAKKGYSVAYSHPTLIGNSLFSNSHLNVEQQTLNVKYLVEIFKIGLAKFEEIINDGQFNPSMIELYNRYTEKYLQ